MVDYIKSSIVASALLLGSNIFAADPVVEGTALTIAQNNMLYSYELNASDVDQDALSWSVTDGTSLPDWLDLKQESFDFIGDAEFNTEFSDYNSLAIDNLDTPYVVFPDYENKATVMKYDGSSWVIVGAAGFTSGSTNFTEIKIDSTNTPYVAFKDTNSSNKITVMKYYDNNNSWGVVGAANFSAGEPNNLSFYIDSNDTAYVAYSDINNNYKATVMKYDGTSWDTVGTAGFSSGTSDSISIVTDSENTPYVTYKRDNDEKAIVKKFNGSSWENVGTAGFSVGVALDIGLAISKSASDDTPYVVFRDSGNSNKLTVKKYDGSSWVDVGIPSYTNSNGSSTGTLIAVDNLGNPFVTYKDAEHGFKITVMKYDGFSWKNVANPGFTSDATMLVNMVIDSSNNPYVL